MFFFDDHAGTLQLPTESSESHRAHSLRSPGIRSNAPGNSFLLLLFVCLFSFMYMFLLLLLHLLFHCRMSFFCSKLPRAMAINCILSIMISAKLVIFRHFMSPRSLRCNRDQFIAPAFILKSRVSLFGYQVHTCAVQRRKARLLNTVHRRIRCRLRHHNG